MAINNPTWVAGTAAQRLISVTKLNQLSADACNTVDDIHPQYTKSVRQTGFIHILEGDLEVYSKVRSIGGTVLEAIQLVSSSNPVIHAINEFSFKLFASSDFTHINFEYSASAVGAAQSVYYTPFKNGDVDGLTLSQSITSIYPTYQDVAYALALTSPAANDLFSYIISLACATTAGQKLYLKNLNIYLSKVV